MRTFPSPFVIERGVVQVNGQKRLLVSADYPYYRDYPENWQDRLARLKSLGIHVITAYLPWRHHQLSATTPPDFSGQTQPNRNVLAFLALCHKLELAVIAKPGPFIHAETNYGGLPDWTSPLNNPQIEALLDAQGRPVCWQGARLDGSGQAVDQWPLPAPFSAAFLRLAQEWLACAGEEVIRPNQSPAGPIVAVQIANEGIYSNGQHAPWAYDYSASSLSLFRKYLQTQYQDLAHYNRLNATAFTDWENISAPTEWRRPRRPENLRLYSDWGLFQAEYMNRIFNEWSAPLETTLPIFINQNPPLGDSFGLDAWLTRVEPERWPGLHYGFTNWVGDISANPSAFDRYLLTAKRFPGINLEENWGFAELYDPAYVDAATSFYQTLAVLNGGATGFNIYTGVATARPDRNLEAIHKAPYPDAAPITEHGALTPKAEIARWLVKFMDCYGDEFLACKSAQPVAWGLYLPHARVGAWIPPAEIEPGLPALGHYLGPFQSQMRQLHLDYGILNLETSHIEELLAYPRLVVSGGPSMSCAVQAKLAVYVRGGGQLAVMGDSLPSHGEAGEPCRIPDAIQSQIRIGRDLALAEWLKNVPRPNLLAGEADVWIRSQPQHDLHFVTVLIPAQGGPLVRLEFQAGRHSHHLELNAARSGGALLRVEKGRVTAAIVKGHNGFLKSSVSPQLIFDDQRLAHSAPGDFAFMDGLMAHLPAVQ